MATLAEKDVIIADLTAKLTSAQRLAADKGEALDAANSSGAAAEAARALAVRQLEDEKAAHGQTRQALLAATDQVAGAGQVIIELNEQLSAAQEAGNNNSPQGRTVKYDGKTYRVTHPKFKFQGTIYDAADVTEGSALLAGLVAIGAGVLEPVE